MEIERSYLYKVFRDGVYLGLLPNVISDFSYHQEVNTPGTQTVITVAENMDTAGDDVDPLETEDGQVITTENDIPITTEGPIQTVGDKDSGLVIANGNDIEVWEYSSYYPNGIKVFAGYQSRMKARIGTDDSTIDLTVISYGKDMDDYIFGNSEFSLQLQQDVGTTDIGIARPDQISGEFGVVGQSFIPLSNFALTKVVISLACGNPFAGVYPASANVTVRIYSGDPLGAHTLLSSVTKQITNVYPSFDEASFQPTVGIDMISGSNYYFDVIADDHISISVTDTNPYANGNLYFNSPGTTLGYISPDYDVYFRLYSGTILTDAIFDNYDPSDMIRDAIDGYRSQGGVVSYTDDSIEDTGYSLDYTFVTSTVLEIVKKARELGPANWYWYVDPATQILSFREASTTAAHTFILGEHITAFDFEATIEYIKNVVYFTGGPTAGVNLLKKYIDSASLHSNRLGMERLSDNRIIAANEPSAAAIADSFMDENSSEVFMTSPLTIHADTYDISTISLGQTVSVVGIGNFVDSVVMQIVGIERRPDTISLELGKLPLRTAAYVDEIKRNLESEQTLANPDSPG